MSAVEAGLWLLRLNRIELLDLVDDAIRKLDPPAAGPSSDAMVW